MGDSVAMRVGVLVDRAWYKIQSTAGYCASNKDLEMLDDALGKAEEYGTNLHALSKLTGGASSSAQQVQDKLGKAAGAISKLREPIGKAREICRDIGTVEEIISAIKILNRWVEPGSTISSAEAASAFDNLFGAAGSLAKKLPPPFNAYSIILEQCKISGFFSRMERTMYPWDKDGNPRDTPDNPHGQALKRAMDEIDR